MLISELLEGIDACHPDVEKCVEYVKNSLNLYELEPSLMEFGKTEDFFEQCLSHTNEQQCLAHNAVHRHEAFDRSCGISDFYRFLAYSDNETLNTYELALVRNMLVEIENTYEKFNNRL